jgi:hypothetical protein
MQRQGSAANLQRGQIGIQRLDRQNPLKMDPQTNKKRSHSENRNRLNDVKLPSNEPAYFANKLKSTFSN